MESLVLILLAGGAWPLWVAWRATATTTLRPSLAWAGAAWAVWLAAVATGASWTGYLALSLSGCAGIAVLGARRPGMGAWNFVVAGLLAVFLLPLAQGFGTPRLETAHVIFLGATLAVPVLNYLPTRLGPVMLLCGLGCAAELARLSGVRLFAWQEAAWPVCLAAGPWAGLLARRGAADLSKIEYTWLRFRDGYGFIWGQRALEQFNRAAANAGWTTRLTWRGIDRPTLQTPSDDELLLTLTAVLKRFGSA